MLDQVSLDLQREPLSGADLALYCGRYCHAASYRTLLSAINDTSSVLLTGPEGVGKGALIQRLRQELPPGIRVLDCRGVYTTLAAFVEFLCERLNLRVNGDLQDRQEVLAAHLEQLHEQGSGLLVVLEQAEQLASSLLVDLLEWVARSPDEVPQFLISGAESLAERLVWIHSLDARALVHCHLSRLNDAEVRDMLRWGLNYVGVDPERLSDGALDSLVRQSQGLPGNIIALCEFTFTLAELQTEGPISEAMLRLAGAELDLMDEGESFDLLLDDSWLADLPVDEQEPTLLSMDLASNDPVPQQVDTLPDQRVSVAVPMAEPPPSRRFARAGVWGIPLAGLALGLLSYGVYRQVTGPALPPAQPAHLVAELPEASPVPAEPHGLTPLSGPDDGLVQATPPDHSVAAGGSLPSVGDAPPDATAPVVAEVNETIQSLDQEQPPEHHLPAPQVAGDFDVLVDAQPLSTVVAREVSETPPVGGQPWQVTLPHLEQRLQDWANRWWANLPRVSELLAAVSPVAETGPESPAPSPPSRIAPTVSISRLSATVLRGGGDRYLERRDPAAARLFFESAAMGGDPQGAMAVAMTYDPLELEARGLRWSYADPELATEWYLYAMELGQPEAEGRLQALTDWLVDQPLPAPEASPLPPEIPMADFRLVVVSPAQEDFLRTGDRWLLRSDPVAARLLYREAAEAGSAVAAVAVAMTYDPVELQRRGFQGISGDADQALTWYRRARDLGAVGVERRIDRLADGSLVSRVPTP